jgi:hypothetical protein
MTQAAITKMNSDIDVVQDHRNNAETKISMPGTRFPDFSTTCKGCSADIFTFVRETCAAEYFCWILILFCSGLRATPPYW